MTPHPAVPDIKPTPKVTAATLTPLIAAIIVFIADKVFKAKIPDEVALSLAGGAALALTGGWLKRDKTSPAPVVPPPVV
jgi:hypothetical protein